MGTVFCFNGNYYKQLDGVAMGSPLGLALANAFLCHHESKQLRECPVAYAPIFHKRYVDDIFVLLKSENHVNNLLFYLNSKHPNTGFTCEIDKNRSLAFLDINTYKGNNKFETSVHLKSTFSGVHTNYRSFIGIEFKSSLITTLLYLCRSISTTISTVYLHILLFLSSIEVLQQLLITINFTMKL